MFDIGILQNAVNNLLAGFLEFTPKLLTAALLLVVGHFIAKLIARLIERVANRIGLNKAIENSGLTDSLAQAQITQSPSEMLSIFIYWLIFLNFILIALDSLGLSTAVAQLQRFIAYLPQVLSALAILVVGALLAQFVGRVTNAAVASMGVDFHETIGQVVQGFLFIIILIVAVGQLGLDVQILTDTFTSLVAIAAAGLALAFGLGGRDVARNVLAGHYARELFSAGDRISVDDREGTLAGIGTLNSEIAIGTETLVIPNTRLTSDQVVIIESVANLE